MYKGTRFFLSKDKYTIEYGRPGDVGMVCFETKEEANTAINNLNETIG